MKTVADFIATLSPEEQTFLEYMEKATAGHQIEAHILLDGKVVKTTMMVAVLWQMHHPISIRVAWNKIGNRELSTVFLPFGTRDQFFETMCFSKKGASVVSRYKTLKEAQAGHLEILKEME